MFVLPRRTLQQQLDDLAGVLSPDQAEQLAKRLNTPGPDRLAAMWELIVLWALSQAGDITHEAELPSGRRPDVTFESKRVNFIADITTVSDAGLHDENGLQSLWADIQHVAKKANLSGNNFSLRAEGEYVGDYGDAKVKLALPTKADRDRVVKEHVVPFIRQARDSGQARSVHVNDNGLNFTLGYNPAQRFAQLSHLSYDVAASRDRNPLGNRLKSKVSQLRGAPAGHFVGIIACDGGCALLRRKESLGSWSTYSRREVALDFLRRTSSVDFVVLLSIEDKHGWHAGATTYHWHTELVVSPEAMAAGRFGPERAAALRAVFEEALRRVPTFIDTPVNAGHRCMAHDSPDMIGGYVRDGNRLKISSRALTKLLAGEETLERFLEAYEWTPGHERARANPFAQARREGRLIKSVRVEPDPDHDDDWLEIEFGDPDPAAAPFAARPRGLRPKED